MKDDESLWPSWLCSDKEKTYNEYDIDMQSYKDNYNTYLSDYLIDQIHSLPYNSKPMQKTNTEILDNMNINDIEQYLRKKKLEKLNKK